MNTTAKDHTNVKYLVIFFIVFGLIILCSLIFRVVYLISQSSFIGQEFNVVVVSASTHVVHINSVDRKASVLTISNLNIPHDPAPNPTRLSYTLGIPVHAIVVDKNREIEEVSDRFFSLPNLLTIMTDPRYIKIGINAVDAVKIYSEYRSFTADNKRSVTISQKDLEPDMVESTDKSLFDMFKNSELINQKVSIHVINGTDINGMGTRFSRIFENWGFNVVSVTTEQDYNTSAILSDTDNQEHIDRILPIFPFEVQHRAKNSIADITVVIAEDTAKILQIGE